MSGGSWDYFYGRLEEVASRLQCERDPLRKAFGSHLQKCAKALHDIEWVDSCDCGPGDDVKAIKAALGTDGPALVLSESRKQAEAAVEQLKAAQEAMENLPMGGIGRDGATQAEIDEAEESGHAIEGDASHHQGQKAWLIIERAKALLANKPDEERPAGRNS